MVLLLNVLLRAGDAVSNESLAATVGEILNSSSGNAGSVGTTDTEGFVEGTAVGVELGPRDGAALIDGE
eukprot:CAMPEP_0171296916 /NCGR_PEP_ID=MMETSP0816-20121228/5641_1 /TAXON_ID=420281 /ORGANISM="Proboscia inermis, Strain CCAP1064/1" /LENGTH=68 /DNA_ID=CAMNT_0011770757 /DNA_START=176 /DNA_END=382 /DNA_ORIENTATION=+